MPSPPSGSESSPGPSRDNPYLVAYRLTLLAGVAVIGMQLDKGYVPWALGAMVAAAVPGALAAIRSLWPHLPPR